MAGGRAREFHEAEDTLKRSNDAQSAEARRNSVATPSIESIEFFDLMLNIARSDNVTFVASQGRYALAFGTGDREDLFLVSPADRRGRFYVILDPGFQPGRRVLSGGPLTETGFQ